LGTNLICSCLWQSELCLYCALKVKISCLHLFNVFFLTFCVSVYFVWKVNIFCFASQLLRKVIIKLRTWWMAGEMLIGHLNKNKHNATRKLQSNWGCQIVYFYTKIPNVGIFWWALEWKMFVCIFSGYLEYFKVIWYVRILIHNSPFW
jgi:hypothetical protein